MSPMLHRRTVGTRTEYGARSCAGLAARVRLGPTALRGFLIQQVATCVRLGPTALREFLIQLYVHVYVYMNMYAVYGIAIGSGDAGRDAAPLARGCRARGHLRSGVGSGGGPEHATSNL